MIFKSLFEALLFYLLILFIFFAFMNFKWIWKDIKEISGNKNGFIKLCQFLFIIMSWIVFFSILAYYSVHPSKVNVLDVMLTVVVGFLGTMIGLFFNQETIKHLEEKVKLERDKSKIAIHRRMNILKLLDDKIDKS